jgi:hypothetical protein
MIRLSNTAIDMYFLCPRKYKYHYYDKLRPTTIGSALIFGISIDQALNRLLLTKKKELTEEDKKIMEITAEQAFNDTFKIADINGTKYETMISDKVDYFNKDLDSDTLEESDYILFQEKFDFDVTKANIKEFQKECATARKEGMLVEELLLAHNFLCWLSLKRKGHKLLELYELNILPQIKEVHSVQIPINLPNSNGDYIIGFVDYVATLNDGIKRILDNKTSSEPYNMEKLNNSQQLAIYSEALEIEDVGYSVLIKKINKNADKQTQILTGKISEEQKQIVFDKIGSVCYSIKNEEFPCNFKNCFSFGRICPYKKLCMGIEDLTGLEIKKDD